MSSTEYAEDVFLSFYKLITRNQIQIQSQDFNPIQSFYDTIITDGELTENQANFLLKILSKYKNQAIAVGVDYSTPLKNVRWRKTFRVLDLSKKIYIDSSNNSLEICVKFPYQLKKVFDDEISSIESVTKQNTWDHVNKVRRLNFYDYNLIALYEFAIKYNFEIDDSFMSVLAEVEEIWQNSDEITPGSSVVNDNVVLQNTSTDALDYWEQKKTLDINKNLLIAKNMGFSLLETPRNLIEKIAHSKENTFWIKDYNNFFYLVNNTEGKVCIILDRAGPVLPWLQNFVQIADNNNFDRNMIKVCFRENKENTSGLNDWIKLAGVGGKVDSGKILIFESKPAKWLFKANIDVTMLVTNNIYPPTNMLTKDWFSCHPCVIYLGSTKPTEQKGHKIVEL